MPLTFAHPAAVLPFIRTKPYFHFTALVLGSMAPDYEYFLRGRPAGEIGHTFTGFFMYNLPLVVLMYLLYRYVIYPPFYAHLPDRLQSVFMIGKQSRDHHMSRSLSFIVFLYSAIIGMITHVVWDSFTHQGGFMVLQWTSLQQSISIVSYDIPVYKIMQHGSTVAGLAILFSHILITAYSSNNKRLQQNKAKSKSKFNHKLHHKWLYWFSLCFASILMLIIWMLFAPISISDYGVLVVRIIDSCLLSLFLVSFLYLRKPH